MKVTKRLFPNALKSSSLFSYACTARPKSAHRVNLKGSEDIKGIGKKMGREGKGEGIRRDEEAKKPR